MKAMPTKTKETANKIETGELDMTKDVAVKAEAPPTTTNTGGMDMDLFNKIKTEPGGGLSKDQADNLVPLIYLLQPLSPQVMKGDPARIEGAEAGDIWLRNAEKPILKGDKEGMVFQPCYFSKDLVEWMPDRGGFVGRHDISCLPNVATKKGWTGTLSDVKEIQDDERPNAPPRYVRSSNNNEIVETRYFVGNVFFEDGRQPLPFVIPLSSTGHSFGKQWMFLMNSQALPDGTPIDKSWVVLYRLKTVMKTNSQGSWYMYTVQKERLINSMQEYELGAALNRAFARGEKKIDDEAMDASAVGGRPESGSLDNNEPL